MIKKYRLFRRAQGTNSKFHLDGSMVECETVFRQGMGNVYVFETNDTQQARRLQIIHGFMIEHRAVKSDASQTVDRAQIKALAEHQKKVEAEAQADKAQADKPKKPARKTRSRKKTTKTEDGE